MFGFEIFEVLIGHFMLDVVGIKIETALVVIETIAKIVPISAALCAASAVVLWYQSKVLRVPEEKWSFGRVATAITSLSFGLLLSIGYFFQAPVTVHWIRSLFG